ncbi:MAG: MFS transporter, partial [Acidimicrobiia bacterium]|nr:MFS transporter [Acidimicrobiia bacterium]
MNEYPVDYSRKWFVMWAVSMGVFLATIDGSIVNIALPTLQEEFGAPFSSVQWVVLAYLLVLGTLSLLFGRLGDMIGKKRIYTTGFIAFTTASAAAATAQSVGMLIGWRIVQAVGAAMILSLGLAILTAAFPATERGKALGLIGTTVSVGIVIGPTMGGLILSAASWHWIFLVNVPVGILGTITSIKFIPNTKPLGGQTFDFPGAALFAASITSLMLGMTLAGERGFGSRLVLSLLALSVVVGAGFVYWERRTD